MFALFLSPVGTGPSLVTRGSNPVQSRNINATGLTCGTVISTVIVINDGAFGVGFTLCYALLVVPYCLIARKKNHLNLCNIMTKVKSNCIHIAKIMKNQSEDHSFQDL